MNKSSGMKRRKHRFYIDVTFSRALELREAAKALGHALGRLNYSADPIYATKNLIYLDKLIVVEIRRNTENDGHAASVGRRDQTASLDHRRHSG